MTTTRSAADRRLAQTLLEHGPLSRGALRERSGLSQPTVLEGTRRLEQDGLVVDVGSGRGGRRGPTARLYDLRADAALVGAVTVGGTRIELALADLRGTELGHVVHDRATQDPPADLATALLALLAEVGADPAALAATVVGTHGLVDPATGDLGFAWDLPDWEHAVLGALREALPGQLRLERDVQLAAHAELADLGPEVTTAGLLWLDTGIGYAGLVDGHPLVGRHGAAGQIGYLPVPGAPAPPLPAAHDPRAPYPGGLQSLVSLAALEELARPHGHAPGTDPTELLADPAVREAYTGPLALGLAAIAALLDPGTVVLGGGIGAAGGEALAAGAKEQLARLSPVPLAVRAGRHGTGGVLRGALRAALETGRTVTWGALTR